MSVSKRLRYEVFRRDNFTCRYCGAKAPDAQLRPDHVVPVALGGSDDPSNLVTACQDCNGGKTSTTPDAPVVADVSADALRWSRAMAEAADRMRAEFAQRQDIYAQFEEWWSGWTYGFYKKPIPRPDDWRNSIDGFLAAGLPMDVLKWCVDKAGASKATPESTWRYMCGIAWKKITELQEAAQAIATISTDSAGSADESDELGRAPAERAARRDMANELLGGLSSRDLEWYLNDSRSNLGPDDPDVEECAAFRAFFEAVRLAAAVLQLLAALPDGDDWLAQAHDKLYEKHGNCYSPAAYLSVAAQIGARVSKGIAIGDLVG